MTVHFVGAGPGAADLITVRAQRLLEQCQVCLYAGSLVPAEVLASGFVPAGVLASGFVPARVVSAGVLSSGGLRPAGLLASAGLGPRDHVPGRA